MKLFFPSINKSQNSFNIAAIFKLLIFESKNFWHGEFSTKLNKHILLIQEVLNHYIAEERFAGKNPRDKRNTLLFKFKIATMSYWKRLNIKTGALSSNELNMQGIHSLT